MSIKLTNDKAAVVDTEHHWKRVDRNPPPIGAKLLLIDRRLGTATQGAFQPGRGWTHFAGLPTFAPDDDYFGG